MVERLSVSNVESIDPRLECGFLLVVCMQGGKFDWLTVVPLLTALELPKRFSKVDLENPDARYRNTSQQRLTTSSCLSFVSLSGPKLGEGNPTVSLGKVRFSFANSALSADIHSLSLLNL
jgi:hypothetical protein